MHTSLSRFPCSQPDAWLTCYCEKHPAFRGTFIGNLVNEIKTYQSILRMEVVVYSDFIIMVNAS